MLSGTHTHSAWLSHAQQRTLVPILHTLIQANQTYFDLLPDQIKLSLIAILQRSLWLDIQDFLIHFATASSEHAQCALLFLLQTNEATLGTVDLLLSLNATVADPLRYHCALPADVCLSHDVAASPYLGIRKNRSLFLLSHIAYERCSPEMLLALFQRGMWCTEPHRLDPHSSLHHLSIPLQNMRIILEVGAILGSPSFDWLLAALNGQFFRDASLSLLLGRSTIPYVQYAIIGGDLRAVKRWLTPAYDNPIDEEKIKQAFYVAAQYGRPQVISMLFLMGHLWIYKKHARAIVLTTIEHGQWECLKLLYSYNACATRRILSALPVNSLALLLLPAVFNKDEKMIRILFRAGANPHHQLTGATLGKYHGRTIWQIALYIHPMRMLLRSLMNDHTVAAVPRPLSRARNMSIAFFDSDHAQTKRMRNEGQEDAGCERPCSL